MKQLRSNTENVKMYETQTGYIVVFDRTNVLEILVEEQGTRYILHFMRDWKTYWSNKHKRTNDKAKSNRALTTP